MAARRWAATTTSPSWEGAQRCRRAGGRVVRRPRHVRQQRRDPARHDDRQHVRGRLRRSGPGPHEGPVAPTRWAAAHWRDQHNAGAAPAAQPRPHQLDVGHLRQPRARATTAAPSRESSPSARSPPRSWRATRSCRTASCPARGRDSRCRRRGCPRSWRRRRRDSTCGRRATSRRWSPTSAALSCPFTGETFYVQGGTVRRLEPVVAGRAVDREPDALAARRLA